MESVVIAIPVFDSRLSRDEEISLRHLELILGDRPRTFVAPRGLQPKRSGYDVIHFDDEYFESVASYSRLLLDPSFYESLEDYEFVLIYQLDCLVFRDELDRFLSAGYDYVGAPWLADRDHPAAGFSRVGNGGLCLRRVASCLTVLNENRPRPNAWRAFLRTFRRRESMTWQKRVRVAREVSRGIGWYRRRYSHNEDHFWADRAHLFDSGFRVADVETGLSFSFDEAPRACFESLGELPMGCHGWFRRDREFWAPHLLPEALDTAGGGST